MSYEGPAGHLEKTDAERRTGGRSREEVSPGNEAGFACFAACGRYDVDLGHISEDRGYADAVYIPLNPGDATFPPMVAEVKTKPNVGGDVARVPDGGYPRRLSDRRGEVVPVEIFRGARTGKRVGRIRRAVKG